MAFPALLFIIAMASTVGSRLDNITFGGVLGKGVLTLVLVFTIFGWFYPARIVRAKVLSLREKEFVEAALMTGASDWRIIRSHLMPHLAAPIIVYSTLVVASSSWPRPHSRSSGWGSSCRPRAGATCSPPRPSSTPRSRG